MPRQRREGLDYHPLDLDFLEDTKVRRIWRIHGADGILVLLRLWSLIYRDKGYYYKFIEDKYETLADDVDCGYDAEFVGKVLELAIERGLFDKDVFDNHKVVTSRGTQKRYYEVIKDRARKAVTAGYPMKVAAEYWLLDDENSIGLEKYSLNPESSRKKDNNSEKNINNSRKNATKERKEKESKERKGKRRPVLRKILISSLRKSITLRDSTTSSQRE